MVGGLAVAIVLGSLGRAFADPAGTLAPLAAVAIAVGLVFLMVGGTWIYFRSVDELEWANNLAAGFWGFNAFMLAFPVWHILWKGGFVPRPDTTAIYLGAATIALAAYLWGRFR
jgi:hypothetical protein